MKGSRPDALRTVYLDRDDHISRSLSLSSSANPPDVKASSRSVHSPSLIPSTSSSSSSVVIPLVSSVLTVNGFSTTC